MSDVLKLEQVADRIQALIGNPVVRARFREQVRAWTVERGSSDPKFPVPFPTDRDLTLAEKYTVLAAIYDNAKCGERIDPWRDVPPNNSKEALDSIPYGILVADRIPRLVGSPQLTRILEEIEAANATRQGQDSDDGREGTARAEPTIPPAYRDGDTLAKQPSVNERMLSALQKDTTRSDWTADQWATDMNCSPGTVKGTTTWKNIMAMRQQDKLSLKSRLR